VHTIQTGPPICIGAHLGYQTHYVVDDGRARIIVSALVTPGEVTENQSMLDLLWHVRFRWKLRPQQVTGDTKYGTLIPCLQARENDQRAQHRQGEQSYTSAMAPQGSAKTW
jgi:hypothetical protein